MPDKTHYDLIILGAGPAGMTAVVYAARKQMDLVIISEDVGGQAMWSSAIENYLGYKFIAGPDLVQKFDEHVRTFNVPQEYTKATRLTRSGDTFRVETRDGREFTARAVIVSTGKSPKMLGIPGEKEFGGRGVTYCATCDGPLYAGKDVAVVGGGNSGLDAVVQLMKICPKVYVVERDAKLRADAIMIKQAEAASNVEILTGTAATEIVGETFVSGMKVDAVDGGKPRQLDVQGVFVEVGLIPNADFAKGVVRLNPVGEIPVDCAARTGVPGLYAAGDVTDVPEKQIIIAAGDGAKAALGAYAYLVRLPVAADDWGPRVT
jgi:alkyl hydroperoxide reductase subunit F